jgi:hypothetical protein
VPFDEKVFIYLIGRRKFEPNFKVKYYENKKHFYWNSSTACNNYVQQFCAGQARWLS